MITESVNIEPSRYLSAWVYEKLGNFMIDNTVDYEKNRNSIFHITSDKGEYFLKIHHDYNYWNAEVYAYYNWCREFDGYYPVIDVFHYEGQYGILSKSLGGIPLDKLVFNDKITSSVWFRAGIIAGNMMNIFQNPWFGIPDCDGKPLNGFWFDPVEYFQSEFEKIVKKAINYHLLNSKQIDLVSWVTRNYNCFLNEKPRAVNKDFTPGNWIVSMKGDFLGIVDLEDICWGLKAELFQHLWTRYGIGHPIEMESFHKGFGEDFMKNNPVQFGMVCVKHGLSNLVNGFEKNSKIHVNRGNLILDRLFQSDFHP